MEELILKEEYVSIDDCKKILDFHFSLERGDRRKWMKEITPFKNIWHLTDENLLKNNEFIHSWILFERLEKDKKMIYLKLFKNNELAVFITLKKRALRNKIIFIDKLISVKPWYWSRALIELAEYYDMQKIKIEASWSAKPFWQKMKERLKWKIDIIILDVK